MKFISQRDKEFFSNMCNIYIPKIEDCLTEDEFDSLSESDFIEIVKRLVLSFKRNNRNPCKILFTVENFKFFLDESKKNNWFTELEACGNLDRYEVFQHETIGGKKYWYAFCKINL